MATILPFKAVRPSRDKVSLIASRAYESYTLEQREARLRDNPFSFLHIINPGFKYQKELTGNDRYQMVRNRYQEFKENGYFFQEQEPAFYIYKIVNRDGFAFHGIVALASTKDYQTNTIRKHEDTMQFREQLFTEYLEVVGFNADPVLLTYPENPALKQIITQTLKERPEYEFTTTYRDTHYLWNVTDVDTVQKIHVLFSKMDALYIADGHHRCASSNLLALQKETAKNTLKSYQYFMAFLIPETELQIFEFNRLVKDLNNLSKEAFLVKLDNVFRIEVLGQEYYRPQNKHDFSMYLDGSFYALSLRKDSHKITNALDALDAQILYETILKPILGITDARNDKRLAYSHGKNEMAYVKTVVDKGDFAVGFGLLPVTTTEIKQIADQGLTMPPKTTYIQPKLRSGVTIYEF